MQRGVGRSATVAEVARRSLAVQSDLSRPTSALLRDGSHELRVEVRNVDSRILYFFAGRAPRRSD